ILPEAAKLRGASLKDAWGREVRLQKRKEKNPTGVPQFDGIELVSAGPDGKFGTSDDVTWKPVNDWQVAMTWWRPGDASAFNRPWGQNGMFLGAMPGGGPGGRGGVARFGAPMPQAAATGRAVPEVTRRALADPSGPARDDKKDGGGGAAGT